jgi:ubiquinone/menaquinone biosynthesis C-methylase UbiE
MQQEAVNYWDKHAAKHKAVLGTESGLLDNIWKRQALVKRLLDYDFYHKSILEIGVGSGLTFAAIRLILLNAMNYRATDMSLKYVDFVEQMWHMNAVQADVTNIPYDDDLFDYVVALDVLEHVDPKDRFAGYKEISRVLKPDGRVILNIPLGESYHEEYDWGFDYRDLFVLINICKLKVEKLEKYTVHARIAKPSYEFFVGKCQIGTDSND